MIGTRSAAWLCAVTLVVGGCGGGGGNSPQPVPPQPLSSQPVSPQPVPPQPAAPPNAPPTLLDANPDQRAIEGHLFSYDAVKPGTFGDIDGDELTYTVRVAYEFADFSVQGSIISGTPTHPHSVANVTVLASDGENAGEAVDEFRIEVRPNTVPAVVRPNMAVLVRPGDHVNYDPTQGGSAFSDDDGDRLTFSVTAASSPRGLGVSGVHVVGSLTEVGVVRFEVVASDGYGGSATDEFAIAAPAPEPGRPTLPSQSYIYADEQLPLPHAFKHSRQFFGPFWDTTFHSVNPPTDAGATLGRVLFYDKRLSITNTHACSSCHEQDHNFAQLTRFSGVLGVPQTRNAMALANARYNVRDEYFIDQRGETLEGLVLLPIVEPTELGNFLPQVVDKLAATDFYPPLFAAAFGTHEVTEGRIRLALAQFVRSLISYRSRFDRGAHPMESSQLPNLSAVLTEQELRGAAIFFGDGTTTIPLRCASCHETGLLLMDTPTNNGLDVVSADPSPFEQFRTPSLRSVAVSGPYMHDGRFATLREVIDHYDHGIQDSPQLAHFLRRDGSPVRMNLSDSDKEALEAFMHTLTDPEFLQDPRFSDPFPQ